MIRRIQKFAVGARWPQHLNLPFSLGPLVDKGLPSSQSFFYWQDRASSKFFHVGRTFPTEWGFKKDLCYRYPLIWQEQYLLRVHEFKMLFQFSRCLPESESSTVTSARERWRRKFDFSACFLLFLFGRLSFYILCLASMLGNDLIEPLFAMVASLLGCGPIISHLYNRCAKLEDGRPC